MFSHRWEYSPVSPTTLFKPWVVGEAMRTSPIYWIRVFSSAFTKIGLTIAGRLALVFLGLLLFRIVAFFAVPAGKFEGKGRSHIRQFPSSGQWISIMSIIIESPATCCVITRWGPGRGSWFLESLRTVVLMSHRRLFALHADPSHCQGCKVTHCIRLQFGVHQPYRYLSSRSLLLMTLNLGLVKLRKWLVWGLPICVAWAYVFFTAFPLRSDHCNRVSLPIVARAFKDLFLLPTVLPIVSIW